MHHANAARIGRLLRLGTAVGLLVALAWLTSHIFLEASEWKAWALGVAACVGGAGGVQHALVGLQGRGPAGLANAFPRTSRRRI